MNEFDQFPNPQDAPRFDEQSQWDAPQWEAPQYEEPQYEEPQYEQPEVSQRADDVPDTSYDELSREAPMVYEPGNWGASAPEPSGDEGWGKHVGDPTPEVDEYLGAESISGHDNQWDDTVWDMPDDEALPERKPEKKKRSVSSGTFFVGFLSLAVLVIGAAAFFAFRVADKTPAGPASPEEAVAALLEALAAEDALGVAEGLLPSEVESLVDPSLALVDELTRIGLIEAGTNLNQVSGLDVVTSNVTMEIETVDDQVRWVTLNGGTISMAGSAAELPTGDTSIQVDLDSARDLASDPFSFAVVEENGSWYPSIWYTVAETARRAGDLPRPAITRKPVGSSSPQEAVARFANATTDMRPSEMLTSMDPVEMRAAYDYSSLFLSDLDSAALELRRDLRSDGSTWNLASLDTSVQEASDRAIVSIDGFVLTGTQGLTDPFTITLEGDCLTADMSSGLETTCVGDAGFPNVALQMRVVKRDGDWFVSAAPNMIYPYVDYLGTIETGSVDSFESLITELIDTASASTELSLSPNESVAEDVWTPVFSVHAQIPAGTPAEDLLQYLASEELPAGFIPERAVLNLAVLNNHTAIADIEPGTVLTMDLFQRLDEEGNVVDEPVDVTQLPESVAEPVEPELFPVDAEWIRVDPSTSAVYAINPDAGEPLWVANRIDGSAVIQVTKVSGSREIRALKFPWIGGWQKARNLEFPAYANSEYAVVVVGDYVVVSLDPLDDSGILLEQARYLAKQIR